MSQKRLFSIISLLLMVTLVLAACERPLPGSGGDDTDTGQPAETTEQTTESTDNTTTDTEGDTDTTNEAAGDTDAGEASAGDTDGEVAEGSADGEAAEGEGENTESTPREEEAANETTEEAYPSSEEAGDAAETDATAETSTEDGASTEEDDGLGGAGDESLDTGDDAGDSGDDAAAGSDGEEEGSEDAAAGQGGEADSGEADDAATEDADSSDEDAAADDSAETADTPGSHTVANGENLYRIGLQYGISWVALAQHNNLSNANQIVEGQVLKIPGGESEEQDPEPAPTPSPQTEVVYTVQPGDNLYRIGVANNISWTQIAEANGIVNPNQIVAGQQLKIPVDKPGSGQQSFMHTVQPAETLFLISLRYGVAWPAVAEANELESPYVIFPGQTLEIPGK